EAALLRPDLPATQAALGCAWGRAGQATLAVLPLRQAVAANPFDLPAARALFQALVETGDQDGQRHLAADYRLLAKAAPQAVVPERWFAESAPSPRTALGTFSPTTTPALATPPPSPSAELSDLEDRTSVAVVWEGDVRHQWPPQL